MIYILTINSYLKKLDIKIENFQELNKNPYKYFISIEDKMEIEKLKNKFDRNYIEGAILIKYNDNTIMGFKYWDLIVELWIYLINLVEDFIKDGKSKIYFPDQAVDLSLENINEDLLLFSLKSDKYLLKKQEFLKCILDSGEMFFDILGSFIGSQIDSENQIKRIKSIKLNLKEKYF